MTVTDLTLPISANLPTFPGSPKPQFIPWNTIKDDKYNLELLFLSSHTGTHVDAPYHFIQAGKKLHEFPASRFHTKATKIPVGKKAARITADDITRHEKIHGDLLKDSSVVFETDWDAKLDTKFYFEKNPGLTVSAAKHLISKGIKLVGIDSPSIDEGIKRKFRVHEIFARNDILILENLTNLKKIPVDFTLVALPLKLKGVTGSPVRAIAVY